MPFNVDVTLLVNEETLANVLIEYNTVVIRPVMRSVMLKTYSTLKKNMLGEDRKVKWRHQRRRRNVVRQRILETRVCFLECRGHL